MFQDTQKYDDIIFLPHHQSEKHPHMDLYDRAAQFSPFAALTGFDAAIEETGRITDFRVELDEDEKAILDIRFREIRESLTKCQGEKTLVALTYFQADALKEGGAYLTVTGRIKKLYEDTRQIVFEDGMRVFMDEVVGLEIVK